MQHTGEEGERILAFIEVRLCALEDEHAALLDLLDEVLDHEQEPEPVEDEARWMRGGRTRSPGP